MKPIFKNITVFLALAILLTSCKNSADVDRAIETFLMFIVQIVAFVLFGISSLVLSIVSSLSTTKSSTPKIIGIILVSLFSIITLSCLMITFEINPKRDYIFFAFVVDAIVIFLCIFFLVKPKSANAEVVTEVYDNDKKLDEIISSKQKNDNDFEMIDDLE